MRKSISHLKYPVPHFWVCDLLFVAFAALYSLLILKGIALLSAGGAVLDSDLQTYAQGMAGQAMPWLFASDAAINSASPANSIPTLERWLASLLAPENAWATGLLRAGCIAIFVFYCGWYLLGRWLYRSPALATLLALTCGITIWVGWGTFWGVAHSDPVPRVFFAALLPFILLLFFTGISHALARPLAALACGLAMWVHGVSALNCGAMLLFCYLLVPAQGMKIGPHLCLFAFSTLLFLTPTLIFLSPSLSQTRNFTVEELSVFKKVFELRWAEDFGHFARRLAAFFSIKSQTLPVLVGGLAGWLAILYKGSPRVRILLKAAPCFAAGLFSISLFSWLESSYAPELGRLPMGHELVRGLRFLIPISWLLMIGGFGSLFGKWIRRIVLLAIIVVSIVLPQDRQHQAAILGAELIAGIQPDKNLRSQIEQANKLAQLFAEAGKIIPEGEAVYAPVDAMQLRYLSLRPLAHSFKDGYIFFYNKDLQGSRRWLELETAAREKDGIFKAWEKSKAPWLLCPEELWPAKASQEASIRLNSAGWLLIHR